MSAASFAGRYGPWALVAGGSEGLGAAFAAELARRGLNLMLVARRSSPLADTAARLRAAHAIEVVTVCADLADAGAIDAVTGQAAGRQVGLVVANAALSPTGAFASADPAEIGRAVDLNCRASALIARSFLPPMAARGAGGLILVSSLAGMQGVPGLAVYSASKAFLIGLGEALWAEHRASGVDVLVACPGAVTTPGYERTAARSAPGTLTPQQVAAPPPPRCGRRPPPAPDRSADRTPAVPRSARHTRAVRTGPPPASSLLGPGSRPAPPPAET